MLTVAAAMTLVATVGILLWQTQTNEPLRRPIAAQQGVQPGGNRATLTLTDGRVLDLSTEKSRIIIGDDITYTDGSPVAPNQDSLQISQPQGGQYQTLPPDRKSVG